MTAKTISTTVDNRGIDALFLGDNELVLILISMYILKNTKIFVVLLRYKWSKLW